MPEELLDYTRKPIQEGFYAWKEGHGVLYVFEKGGEFFVENPNNEVLKLIPRSYYGKEANTVPSEELVRKDPEGELERALKIASFIQTRIKTQQQLEDEETDFDPDQ